MKNILLIFLLILPFTGRCQLLDSLSLDTMTACTNVQEALRDTTNVLKLDLSKQRLSEFPKEIRKLTNLQYLDLSRNKITNVPPWIGELKNLQYLILYKNKIDTLPVQIGELGHLKYLDINRTDLEVLPHSIGNLKELQTLILWSDNISSYPYELRYLSDNLKILDLRDVLVNDASETFLKTILPHTTIYFSPICPCER
jgi:Leucine-rich repeat (LRR) protein